MPKVTVRPLACASSRILSVSSVTPHVRMEFPPYSLSLDILGVNTYGDISYLPKAIQSYGWTKPYIVAEWGPYGWWEVPKTSWGASLEENSAQKAGTYSKSLQAILSDKSNCLGSYVFYWGQKQEHTSTWFGLFTAAGEETEVMDVLVEGWSGSKPGNRAPHLESFSIEGYVPGKDFLCLPNSTMNAEVVVVDPDNDPLKYEWQLVPESNDKKTGGDAERAPLPVKGIFSKSALEKTKITFKVPASGEYRLFIFVHDGKGKVATANVPFKIKT